MKRKVAIQGVAGCFHDIACRQYFKGDEVEVVPCETFKELFTKVRSDNSLIGIAAIENTIAGSLLENHNLLRESGLKIMGEIKLRIEHSLVCMPGQSIADIKEVHSHPVALMQCQEFLAKYPDIKVVEADDTAASAMRISRDKIMGRAAICGSLAADIYGMDVLASGIETNKRNFTRFLIIGDPWTVEEHTKNSKIDKASIVFSLPHEEGSLAQVLSILSYYRMNLTKIQSLPILGREWEYLFYVNLTFSNYLKYTQSLDAIRPFVKELGILGEYEGV